MTKHNQDIYQMSFWPLLIILAATLWALDGLLRLSLYGLPPATLIFFEHLIGLIMIAPFAWREWKKTKLSKSEKGSLFAVSLLSGVIGTLLFTTALGAVGYIPMSVAILIQKLQPIFAISVALAIGKERISWLSLMFVCIAIVAGYFVTFPNGVSWTADGQKEIFAALCALGAAAAWWSSTNFSKHLLEKNKPEVVTLMRFAVTTLIIAAGLMLIPQWRDVFRIPVTNEWIYLVLIAFSTGLVAMYIYYRGLRSVPVHVSAILELTWPVVAVVADYFIYGTRFAGVQYFAMAVLIISMYMVTHLSRKQRTAEFPLGEKEVD